MKLGTIKSQGSRDGQLVVVSRDLQKCVLVPDIAQTLQYALDYWDEVRPKLESVYNRLLQNEMPDIMDFNPSLMCSPLPRAYQWADGSAYVNHVELVRKARGAEMPPSFWTDPLMYQGGSDDFLDPRSDILAVSEAHGIDFESEVAIITKDVPMGADKNACADKICLVMLVNDVSLRNLIPAELAKGFGFFHSKPSSSFSPVAVTLDELGSAWKDNKVHLPLITHLNHELFGKPNAGVDMTFDFSELISHAAKTRNLSAGCIIGSGTVSNLDRSSGSSCLAEKRMLETLEHGSPKTPFMKEGDRVRIEMLGLDGQSIFGSIDQQVKIVG